MDSVTQVSSVSLLLVAVVVTLTRRTRLSLIGPIGHCNARLGIDHLPGCAECMITTEAMLTARRFLVVRLPRGLQLPVPFAVNGRLCRAMCANNRCSNCVLITD